MSHNSKEGTRKLIDASFLLTKLYTIKGHSKGGTEGARNLPLILLLPPPPALAHNNDLLSFMSSFMRIVLRSNF